MPTSLTRIFVLLLLLRRSLRALVVVPAVLVLLVLLVLLVAGNPARGQSAVELTEAAALRKRFPPAQYGVLLPGAATVSPAAVHRTWRPMRAGRWRWPGTVRTSVAAGAPARLLSVLADGLRPLPAGTAALWPDPAPPTGARLAAAYLIALLPAATRTGATIRALEPVWYVADSLPAAAGALAGERAGWLLTWGHAQTRVGAWEVLLDEASGQPARAPRDLLSFHHAPNVCSAGPPRDTTARSYVFRPDPLTTAQQPYGRPYLDSLDTDRPALNQQRVLDTLWLTFANDSFRLRNRWFEVAEFDPPARRVVAAPTATGLHFTRSQSGFQQVNAFYHLTRCRHYLARLGFAGLLDQRIRVDASGLGGADQSRFSPLDTTLAFGEGGVDDAEDADVVLHEYLHALAFAAAPGTNIGLERRTLDEGNADYWAAVHSAELGGPAAYGREQVFNWDGHNEFWPGRWVISPKLYPRNLVGNIYLDADVWSATLWQIRAALPPLVADRIWLQHLYSYAPNLTMPQAARLLLQADTLLYGGAHATTIFTYFDDRHILGNHVVVGVGGAVPLAQTAPAAGLHVWATEDFAHGGTARVRAPPGARLVLLNAVGARIWSATTGPDGLLAVPAGPWPAGVYLLRCVDSGRAGVRLLRH